jgi:hypothetical protein
LKLIDDIDSWQRFAFNVRDETINILRMAVEKPE